MDDSHIPLLLSAERLAPFVTIAGTEQDAIELHNQAIRLSSALMPVIALIEISMRNAISEALRNKLQTPNWLTTPPSDKLQWHGGEQEAIKKAIVHARRAAYAKLNNAQKKALDALAYPQGLPRGLKRNKRIRARQDHIQVGIGQTIAQLTMSFWKGLFAAEYEAVLWKPVLRSLFPNKSTERVTVAAHLEVIYEARNRIAHHEAVLDPRLQALEASITFLTENFGSRHPDPNAILARMAAPFQQELRTQIAATRAMVAQFSISTPAQP